MPERIAVVGMAGTASALGPSATEAITGAELVVGGHRHLSVVAGLIVIAMVYLTFRQTRRMGTPEPIEGSNA